MIGDLDSGGVIELCQKCLYVVRKSIQDLKDPTASIA